VISTYLRPSSDFGRTITVESFGSGSTALSSLSVSTARLAPSSVVLTVMSEIAPTRAPPIRTSLPTVRFAPLGTSTLSW
jgi:hypothetical protein